MCVDANRYITKLIAEAVLNGKKIEDSKKNAKHTMPEKHAIMFN